jgi:hypothetical protein
MVFVRSDRPVRVFKPGEVNALFRDAEPPTDDDVSITKDGRRLDTAEKVIEFFAELDAELALKRSPSGRSAPAE